ncbi:MAG: Na+/H+ antiporter subunit E [Nitrospirales bacterium]
MNPSLYKTLTLKTVAFFIIWLILSGKYNLFHMGLGLVVSLGVAWLNSGDPTSPFRNVPWLRIVWYFPWLFGRIVQSSLHLTALILHPSLPIAPRLIHYRTKLQSQAAVVLLGNSITLTPGTITAEVSAHELIVHAMDEQSGHDLTSQRLEQKIAQVFQPQEGAE